MSEKNLEVALRQLVSNLYTVYLEAHAAHWNVEGPLFPMLHEFFGDYYQDVFGSIDFFAESLRQHEVLAPSTLSGLPKNATIKESNPSTNGTQLLQQLYGKNKLLMTNLKKVSSEAAAVDDQGLQNFAQERLGKHLKWDWQFRVQLKKA